MQQQNTTLLSLGVFTASLILVGAGCFNRPAPVEEVPVVNHDDSYELAQSIEAGVYQVDTTQSLLEWYGEKRVGASHKGSIDISYGQVTFDQNGSLINGIFTIDMTTIDSYEDIAALEAHLHSADFFDTANHPEATMTLTRSEMAAENGTYTIIGELTIKGITHELTFPVTVVSESEGHVRAVASFEVDRSLYDVRFGSSNFFTDLGDGLIENDMQFDLVLIAEKVSQATTSSVHTTEEQKVVPAENDLLIDGDSTVEIDEDGVVSITIE